MVGSSAAGDSLAVGPSLDFCSPLPVRTRAPVSACWRDQPLRALRAVRHEEGTEVRALGDDTTQPDEVAYQAVPFLDPGTTRKVNRYSNSPPRAAPATH